jgi:hypothetical protein
VLTLSLANDFMKIVFRPGGVLIFNIWCLVSFRLLTELLGVWRSLGCLLDFLVCFPLLGHEHD